MKKKKKPGRKRRLTPEQYKSNQNKVSLKWKKEHLKSVNLSLHSEKDADIIEWLEQHRPKQTYIRSLIRAEMERTKK